MRFKQVGLADEGLGAVVRAAAPYRNAAGSGFDDDAHRVEPLVFFERGGLAGGAAGDQKIDA